MPTDLADRLRSALDGRYDIEGELGHGGMGRVYRARDVRHERPVAVKVLREDIAAVLGAPRFEREVAVVARLNHPHILPLFDSGRASDLLYYVMPLVEGETLRARIDREKQLPVADAVGIACEVADALSHAHSRGVVHRDVKPENILLQDGHALLADFGIARALATVDTDTLTDSGLIPGTPIYMSPEQAGGDAVDGRSDIYSLGCVLHEMLAGDPPFQGKTIQVTLRQHVLAPPPPLDVVRPAVTAPVVAATRKALAKVPADRFATGAQFVEALRAPTPVAVPAFARERPRVRWRTLTTAGAVAGVAVVAAALILRGGPTLDPNRVMVFPFAWSDAASAAAGGGWDVALAIGAALEHTEPLRWLDGWAHLPDPLRNDPRQLSPGAARRASRERGAGFYVDGIMREGEGETTVTVRIHDMAGDSLVAQETETGAAGTAPANLGLIAMSRLLPRVLATDGPVDLRPLLDRALGAIALFIQGDKAYRRSRFATALDFYRRAVAEDSLLAFAAVKGAQAASWENEYAEARELIDVAAAHEALLPGKYRSFVHGWRLYLAGDADSAVSVLRATRAADRDWSESAMALGEVYYHLLPTEVALDSLAAQAFEDALESDTLFVPALFHLGEIAVRRGDTRRAERLLARMEAAGPDRSWVGHVAAMLDCARAGAARYDWAPMAARDPSGALLAARSLAAGGASPACAARGFRAVLGAPDASRGNRWAALMGLQAVLLAQGRDGEALNLLDSAQQAGSRGVYALYVLNDIVSASFRAKAAEAEDLARRFTDDIYRGAEPATRWLLGIWNTHHGNSLRARELIDDLTSAASEGRNPVRSRIGAFLAAHRAAALGDAETAIAGLLALVPGTPGSGLMWDLTGSLAPERALLAELLLAAGRYDDAEEVAAVFDHQEPVVFLPFLPRSLAIRIEAADARGRTFEARRYRERLRQLGWAERQPPPYPVKAVNE